MEAEANKLAKPKLGDVGDGGDAVLNDSDGPVVKEGSIDQLSEIEYKELTGYEYLDTQLGNLKDKVKLNQYQSAESVNDWWAKPAAFFWPPTWWFIIWERCWASSSWAGFPATCPWW